MYGGQSSHIPLKVNMSGVLPVIFASSILSIPPTIQLFVNAKSKFWTTILGWFNQTSPLYVVIYFFMIIFFAYFYSQIQYNPVEMANNLRKIPAQSPNPSRRAYGSIHHQDYVQDYITWCSASERSCPVPDYLLTEHHAAFRRDKNNEHFARRHINYHSRRCCTRNGTAA